MEAMQVLPILSQTYTSGKFAAMLLIYSFRINVINYPCLNLKYSVYTRLLFNEVLDKSAMAQELFE